MIEYVKVFVLFAPIVTVFLPAMPAAYAWGAIGLQWCGLVLEVYSRKR